MIRPTAGSGTVLGKQVTNPDENRDLRKRIAYVAEDKPLYGYMTVEQTIRFASAFYTDWRRDLEKSLLRDYDLPLQRKVKTLSKGMRTKLALLLAFARRPDLLILDEPSEGLDPVGIEHLLQALVAHGRFVREQHAAAISSVEMEPHALSIRNRPQLTYGIDRPGVRGSEDAYNAHWPHATLVIARNCGLKCI